MPSFYRGNNSALSYLVGTRRNCKYARCKMLSALEFNADCGHQPNVQALLPSATKFLGADFPPFNILALCDEPTVLRPNLPFLPTIKLPVADSSSVRRVAQLIPAIGWGRELTKALRQGGGGEVNLFFTYSRCRNTIVLFILTMPEWMTSETHRPGRRRAHQTRSTVKCAAIRVKGKLNPTGNQVSGDLGHRSVPFLHIGRLLRTNVYIAKPLPVTAVGSYLVGALPYINNVPWTLV